ncbi:MAG: hypothetical protein CW338_12265 [Clostridiales bacterium]|nr:hypothetical protein [Clostridiales bacterium]
MADAYAVPDDELENVTGGVPLSAWTALYGAEAARKQQEEDKEKDKRSARDFREKAFGAVRNANGN